MGPIFLLGAALIWGLAFVFQRSSMEHVGPFTFGAFRYALSALCLFPFAYPKRNKKIAITKDPSIRWGVLCGLFLFCGTSLQQTGLVYSSAGKAGFITALYIVVVPLLGGIFLKQHVSLQSWLCVLIATAGFYLLSIRGGFSIELGDFIIFIGVFFLGWTYLGGGQRSGHYGTIITVHGTNGCCFGFILDTGSNF